MLIVDDDGEGSEPVERALRRAGHAVRCVPNGRDALVALSLESPDVVILDLKMPEMDGVSFLEVIRCYLRWSTLPVVVLTAVPDGPHARKAVELGARRVFRKSDYDLGDLVSYVQQCAVNPAPGNPGGASAGA